MINKVSYVPKNTCIPNFRNNANLKGMSFDEFIRQPQARRSETVQKKNVVKALAIGIALTTAAALIAFGLIKNKSKINDFIENAKLKRFSNDLAKKFPQDDNYRKRLAASLGLSEKESYKLSSVAGVEELRQTMENYSLTPQIFSSGTAVFDINGKLLEFKNENVLKQTFGANLHIHTENSDGKLTVQKLLDDSASYANKRIKSQKQPFYIAITDHDTVEGCKEAVEIIKKNPQKYKNLRLFLGMETTLTYKNPEYLDTKGQIHILSYGINPYSKETVNFVTPLIRKNHENINSALKYAKKKYGQTDGMETIDFSLDDFAKITKSIKTGLRNSNLYMKDYLQFKLIYTQNVAQNEKLAEVLKKSQIDLSKIDYSKPIELIGKNLDYSQGQKHYDYYYKALQKYILGLVKEKNPHINEAEVQKTFPKLSEKMISSLDEIEQLVYADWSRLYVPQIELVEFEKGIEALSKMQDGVLSFAHPGIIFPEHSVKNSAELPKLYKKLFSIFKEKGKEKAHYVEGFYQTYDNTPELSMYKKLIEMAKDMGLKQTGGIDTHSTNIFSI